MNMKRICKTLIFIIIIIITTAYARVSSNIRGSKFSPNIKGSNHMQDRNFVWVNRWPKQDLG